MSQNTSSLGYMLGMALPPSTGDSDLALTVSELSLFLVAVQILSSYPKADKVQPTPSPLLVSKVILGRLGSGEGSCILPSQRTFEWKHGDENADLLTPDLALLQKTESGRAWGRWQKPLLPAHGPQLRVARAQL